MIASIVAPDWQTLRQWLRSGDAIYRGQANHEWPIETSLHREGQRSERLEGHALWSRERLTLSEFRRAAHQFAADLPNSESPLEWLALIQHYGGATRLLDFSYSCYVALYFALETSDGDSAVWAIKQYGLRGALRVSIQLPNTTAPEAIRDYCNGKFDELITQKNPPSLVLPVEPTRIHQRLWTQQGTFLAPSQPNESFLSNLANGFKKRSHAIVDVSESDLHDLHSEWDYSSGSFPIAIKYIVPKRLRSEILSELRSMNITSATLFPGLEGFARSLRYFI